MEKYSPQAWMLNYSNPAAIVAGGDKKAAPGSWPQYSVTCQLLRTSYGGNPGIWDSRKDMDISYYGLERIFRWWTKAIKDHAEMTMPVLKEHISKKRILCGSTDVSAHG